MGDDALFAISRGFSVGLRHEGMPRCRSRAIASCFLTLILSACCYAFALVAVDYQMPPLVL